MLLLHANEFWDQSLNNFNLVKSFLLEVEEKIATFEIKMVTHQLRYENSRF